jgi:two-component system copper resistance phosphate regulon response regulator CusR
MGFLIIEDNERLAKLLQDGFGEHGYAVETTPSGETGETLAVENDYELIILDLMLPDRHGTDICRELRRRGVDTPILMLTALGSTDEKLAGFEAGADDYLTKPFDLPELLARVKALLRRAQPAERPRLEFGGVAMDLIGRQVTRDGETIELTTKEFALLEYFLRNPDRVLTRANIGERVWDMLFEEDSNVIEVYVSRLRSKIDKGRPTPLIHTVIGTGYVLSEEREPAGASHGAAS